MATGLLFPSHMAPGMLLPEKESTTYYVPESSRKQMQSYANTEIRGKSRDFEAQSKRTYNDWRDDFFKHGYSLVKQAVPRERALGYQQRALDWLTKFNLGLDYDDPSTFNSNHLPVMMNGGMVLNYCAAHEDWVWQTRCEDGVIKPFSQLWETDELLVSFDAVNITLPDRKDVTWRPWPHVDQAPTRSGLACAQGVVLLSDAGPKDGGLIVMRGSAALFEQYFRENPPAEKPADAPGQFDWYGYKTEELKWFEDHGCEMIKIEAEAGDMVIWDSRCIHHASLPENGKTRTVVYAAYTPRALASEKDLELKQQCFKKWEGTTHWPHCNIFPQGKAYRDGKICPNERDEPLEKPELTDKLLKLAGVRAY